MKFFVYSDIEIEVNAENKEQAREQGIQKAIDEKPLVSWLVDEQQEILIEEIPQELTYEQEDLIIESGLEKWRENRK